MRWVNLKTSITSAKRESCLDTRLSMAGVVRFRSQVVSSGGESADVCNVLLRVNVNQKWSSENALYKTLPPQEYLTNAALTV